ncbi:MAG: glycosyltransferase family 4 protein [Myxococcota bacterium]
MSETIHVLRAGSPDDFNGSARYLERLIQSRRIQGDRVVEHRLPRGASSLDSSTREQAHSFLRTTEDRQLLVVEALALPGLVYALPTESARRLCVIVVFHRPAYSNASLKTRDRLFAAERDAYRSAHRVVTSSLHGAMALGPLGVLPDQIGVVPAGIDPGGSARGSASGCSLLMIGQVIERKGHFDVIDALAPLSAYPWRLQIVGSWAYAPDYVARLKHKIKDAGLEGRIVLRGALPSDELRGALDDSDLFVSASWDEASALAVLDAAAAGIPSLVTNVGGSERTLPAKAGFVVPSREPSAMREVLKAWLGDEGSRQRIRASVESVRPRLRRWSEAEAEFEREIALARRFSAGGGASDR